MTDFVIPEEAVEAAVLAFRDAHPEGVIVGRHEKAIRAVLTAALPHLRAHQAPTCRGCSIDPSPDPSIPDQFISDGDCPVHGEAARLNLHQHWHSRITPETRSVVDREAMEDAVGQFIKHWPDGPLARGHVAQTVDAVLALLPTEAETKALAETVTRVGYELGRKDALEEAAAKADWLAEGVANPEKPYNDAFVHACGVVARHIRDLAS